MTDEVKDGFNHLKELAEHIYNNVNDGKFSIAKAQAKLLQANIDVLESEIEFSEQ